MFWGDPLCQHAIRTNLRNRNGWGSAARMQSVVRCHAIFADARSLARMRRIGAPRVGTFGVGNGGPAGAREKTSLEIV